MKVNTLRVDSFMHSRPAPQSAWQDTRKLGASAATHGLIVAQNAFPYKNIAKIIVKL